jgi:hypothetical protein
MSVSKTTHQRSTTPIDDAHRRITPKRFFVRYFANMAQSFA